MKKISFEDCENIQQIIEHCIRIENAKNRFGDSFDDYEKDADYRDVICMNLLQIGEVANQISDEVKSDYSYIAWNQMYGLRNILAHAYLQIEDEAIWNTVKKDIPELKENLEEIL